MVRPVGPGSSITVHFSATNKIKECFLLDNLFIQTILFNIFIMKSYLETFTQVKQFHN